MLYANASRNFYNPRPGEVFEACDWRKRAIVPDYSFRTDCIFPKHPLMTHFGKIELKAIENPAQAFSFYFSLGKLNELKRRLQSLIGPQDLDEVADFFPVNDFQRILMGNEARNRIQNKIAKNKAAKFLEHNKSFIRVSDAAQVYQLKVNQYYSLNQIAKELRIPFGRVKYIWRLITKENGQMIVKAAKKADTEKTLNENFSKRIDQILTQNVNKSKSAKALYQKFQELYGNQLLRNLQHFYGLLRFNGYTYHTFRYKLPSRITWTSHQDDFLGILLLELVTNCHDFDVFFQDESTICPQNFRKMAWGRRGKQVCIISNLKYEKVKIFGLMSRDSIFALRFLKGNNSQQLFDDFIISAMKRYFAIKENNAMPVIFLDNSPLHKSRKLNEFCVRNKILLIFNLAYNPTANPIELLWRHLKTPFKGMIDASR